MVHYAEYDSPAGPLLLESRDGVLTGLWMNREMSVQTETDPVLEATKTWLDDYFQEKPGAIAFPLAPEGTAFQRQVWQILLTIPFGETRSYGSIAREMAVRLGKEKMSAQAVGQAVGKNPISILIPCHRVIGEAGQLTGYAGGLDRKSFLLRHEGCRIQKNRVLKAKE